MGSYPTQTTMGSSHQRQQPPQPSPSTLSTSPAISANSPPRSWSVSTASSSLHTAPSAFNSSYANSRATSRTVSTNPSRAPSPSTNIGGEIDDRHSPRILCLHGGGTNADIFRMQCRQVIRYLPGFRLVFADAPWFCNAGPGVVPVYESCGPFRRWLRWLPEHAAVDDDMAIDEVMYALETCMREDGGTGAWVGVLGFSQGAKLASSLLYEQQIRKQRTGTAPTDFKFGVIMNGRGPIVSFSDLTLDERDVARPGSVSEGVKLEGKSAHVLRIPTIHVHGLSDPGVELHRLMLKDFHDARTTTLIEWEGDHRVPIRKPIVEKVCDEIFRVARQQGVDVDGCDIACF